MYTKHMLLLLLGLLFSGCWIKDKKTKNCRDLMLGDWISTDFKGPYSDESAIYLSLDDDHTGKIVFEYDSGERDAFDITKWSVDDDCERFEFTDEDNDDADFEILQLDEDRLEIKGFLYDDPYTINCIRR